MGFLCAMKSSCSFRPFAILCHTSNSFQKDFERDKHFFHHSTIPPSVPPSIHPSINPSIHPSIHPSINPSIHPFVHPFTTAIHPALHPTAFPSLYSSTNYTLPTNIILPSMHAIAFQSVTVHNAIHPPIRLSVPAFQLLSILPRNTIAFQPGIFSCHLSILLFVQQSGLSIPFQSIRLFSRLPLFSASIHRSEISASVTRRCHGDCISIFRCRQSKQMQARQHHQRCRRR